MAKGTTLKGWNGLLDCKVEPMNEEMSKLFLQLSFTEMSVQSGKAKPDVVTGMDEHLKDSPGYQILKTRLEAFKKNFSPTLDIGILPQVFCALMCDRPGTVVMWAYTLNEIFVKSGQPVTMAALANAFPWGFPTEDEMHKAWEAQKVERPKDVPFAPDNGVDYFENWSLPAGKN